MDAFYREFADCYRIGETRFWSNSHERTSLNYTFNLFKLAPLLFYGENNETCKDGYVLGGQAYTLMKEAAKKYNFG